MENLRRRKREELANSKIAVCLVGGARRFELTGPSIIEKILRLWLLKDAPRLAWVRILEPKPIVETEPMVRVLTPKNSPNGIKSGRVDGYWADPLDPEYFIPGQYLVPPGSSYGGLNDGFGVGDLNTSTVALSRLSLIPDLDSAGLTRLNSEYGVPVAALSSRGPLNGAKCRPCTVTCSGSCVAKLMRRLDRGWSWTEWKNGMLELCDARRGLEKGWEKIFDDVAGEKLARARKLVGGLDLRICVEEFDEMRGMTVKWEAPASEQICTLGLRPN
ncbi:unnamed protein product [Arabis nemorensis]|uniref:DUF7796 domain-containing protein n=1 Tax=Arabis nemorensis TaxID=586526 RepID=A0A565B1D3_9BRAS|nr:unnamed protein product [Arabis nemorensis]